MLSKLFSVPTCMYILVKLLLATCGNELATLLPVPLTVNLTGDFLQCVC